MAETGTAAFDRRLRAAVETIGTHLVGSLPTIGPDSRAPQVTLAPEEFCGLIAALKPKAIYWEDVQFDAEEEARGRLSIELDGSDEPGIADHPALVDLLRVWRKRHGKTSLLVTCFLSEGVIHTCAVKEDWCEDFEVALEEVYLAMAEILDASRQAERRKVDPAVHERAAQLAGHAAFNAPKASKEKRTYLAETLFPDLTPNELWRVVDRATSIAWLRDATVDEDD